MNQNNFNQTKKRLGNYSIIDNKVRVNYKDGTESVLFEDIASISHKTISKPNFFIYLGCMLLGFLITIVGISYNNPDVMYVSITIMIIGLPLTYIIREKFDNIIIETRGGKEIIFSVEYGAGLTQMEKIEKDRREHRN